MRLPVILNAGGCPHDQSVPGPMSIQTRRVIKSALLTISVIGRFEIDDHRDFRRACKQRPAADTVVVDLERCTELDRAATGRIALLDDRAQDEGYEVRIVGCSEELRRVLERVQLQHLLA